MYIYALYIKRAKFFLPPMFTPLGLIVVPLRIYVLCELTVPKG